MKPTRSVVDEEGEPVSGISASGPMVTPRCGSGVTTRWAATSNDHCVRVLDDSSRASVTEKKD